MSALSILLSALERHYLRIAPDAAAVRTLLQARGETLENDHLALRTVDAEGYDLESLSSVFLEAGYICSGDYTFPKKHLVAKSFRPPANTQKYPHVFISHLLPSAFSDEFQQTLDAVIKSGPRSARLALENAQGFSVDFATYQSLAQESEYAAWVSAFGICANHFTISVNALTSFGDPPDLRRVNRAMSAAGMLFNGQDDFVQGSPALLLEQSSTVAPKVVVEFQDRSARVPGAYVEFAKRYPNEEGELYSGFVTQSADRIFESTNRRS